MYRDELGPIWSTLDHPFVVPFLGVTEGENSLPALKTAYFENGNVITYNNKNVTHEADKLRQVSHPFSEIANCIYIVELLRSCS